MRGRTSRGRPSGARAVSIIGLVGSALLAACGTPPMHGIAIDPPRDAPALTVTRPNGAPRFDLAAERGRAVLLFFGYTHCPDICPTTLADWVKVKRQLGATADRVRFVFVSVDPVRDTPAVAHGYATQFDPSFIGLSPDTLDLPAIQYGFGITSTREAGATPEDYLVSHASQAFLVSPTGQLLAMYPFGASVEDVVTDLRTVLR